MRTERPLNPIRRALLTLLTAVVLLLAYAFVLFVLAFNLFVVGFLIVILIPAARFLLAGPVARDIARQWRLVRGIAGALKIEPGSEYGVALSDKDAPGLFDVANHMAAAAGTPPPRKIQLVLPANAGVRLRGYRTANEQSELAVGMDLLAGFTVREIECVIAHEMAHARLIQPGFSGWLRNAVARLVQCAMAVSYWSAQERVKAKWLKYNPLEWLFHKIARLSSRLQSALQRQQEFEADRKAAEICGGAPYRDMMLKLRAMSEKAAPLSYRDRAIQIQRPAGYLTWLTEQLAVSSEELTLPEKKEKQEPYDTHPALRERLAALPETPARDSSNAPALSLLNESEHLARQLFAEIERQREEDERSENALLRRWIQKDLPARKSTFKQLAGLTLAILAFLCVAGLLMVHYTTPLPQTTDFIPVGIFAVLMVVGIWLSARGGSRETTLIPLPEAELFLQTYQDYEPPVDNKAWVRQAEGTPIPGPPESVRGRKARARWWGARSAIALSKCDFATALATGRKALSEHGNELSGLLGVAVAGTYARSEATMGMSFEKALNTYGLGPSVSWALGWASLLWENWPRAEGYLHEAIALRPPHPTLWTALATCQWNREKHREAVASARKAVALAPESPRLKVMLARMLVDAERPVEAGDVLATLTDEQLTDERALWTKVRVELLMERREEADRTADRLVALHSGWKSLSAAAAAYGECKHFDRAEAFAKQADALGFLPQTKVMLGHLARERGDKEEARRMFMAALDCVQPRLDDSMPIEKRLVGACQGLLTLEEPVMCLPWHAALKVEEAGGKSAQLAFLIAAPTEGAARDYAITVWRAMYPATVGFPPPINITPATEGGKVEPAEVLPGIHNVGYAGR